MPAKTSIIREEVLWKSFICKSHHGIGSVIGEQTTTLATCKVLFVSPPTHFFFEHTLPGVKKCCVSLSLHSPTYTMYISQPPPSYYSVDRLNNTPSVPRYYFIALSNGIISGLFFKQLSLKYFNSKCNNYFQINLSPVQCIKCRPDAGN